MNLSAEQRQQLLQDCGVWVTTACDKCGQLLGAVRWTRKGEPGKWCSAPCRDGISAPKLADAGRQDTRPRQRIGARPAGRPRKHKSNAEKCRAYRKRLKRTSATRNTPLELSENAPVENLEKVSCTGWVVPRIAAVLEAPNENYGFARTFDPEDRFDGSRTSLGPTFRGSLFAVLAARSEEEI